MGVTGLWRLLEAAGAPVPLETLENKVLAVDISIWLHQMVKGYQDARGAPMPNAHLLGLFQRLCKLLYYRIKPVFVFDGGFPDLKKETIAKRQDHKAKINSESERLKREILLLLGKKTAIGSLLGKQASPKKGQKSDSFDDSSDDIYKLPALEKSQEDVSSESESEDEDASGPSVDLHSVDVNSESFKNLPLKEKHDLLIELKETRKMNSWGKLHELPKNSDNFSDFQMQRLLKRRKVQECLEETEKEIGGNTMSLNELESLLNEEGINTNIESLPTRRIASNENTRFLLINNVKQALEEARKKELAKNKSESAEITEDQKSSRKDPNQAETSNVQSQNIEVDEDLQKAIQMSLECVDDVEKAANESEISPDSSFMLDSDYSDTSEENDANYDDYEFSSAKAYIMQNSDLTSNTIKSIINKTVKTSKIKPKPNRVEEILDELSNVPTGCVELINEVIGQNEDNVNIKAIELSSSDDESIVEVNHFETVNVSSNENEIFSLNSTLEESSVSSDVKSTVSKSKVDRNDKSVVEIQTDEEDQIETLPEKETGSGSFLVKESDIEPFQEKEINSGAFLESGTDSEDAESDDEFEEVPESISTLKPVVQLNLEIKDTIEDDIFADIFENTIETKVEDPNIQVINLTEKPLTDENEKSIVEEINNRKEKIQNIDEDLQKDIEWSLRDTEITNKSVIKIDKLKPNEHNSEAEKSSLELPNSKTVQHIHEKATIVDVPTTSYNNEMSKNIEKDNASTDKYSTEELNTIADQLQTEHEDLLQEKSRLDRMGRNITQQMTQDAQELLQIFGIPYIVAPTEAEAQCAFLESVKLTDGTITDDSDIWLFGGKTVYKNFFNQKKHVVQYLAERIEKSFNLSREQLVLLALLVGSDYTTGVNGVGPVTAMEILASFSCSRRDLLDMQTATNAQVKYSALVKGLQEFKRWVRSGKRTDDTSLRKKLKNVTVTDDFPSVRVVQAYMDPKIEKNEEKFTWGDPDVTVLREFTKKKFGWSQSKLDEVLNPVLKRMEQRSQKSIQDYFKRKIQFHSLEDQMSKRVKAAVNRMDPELDPDSLTNMEPPKKVPRKRKATKAKLTDASKVNEEIVESIAEEADERLDKPSTSKSEPKKKSPAIVKSISVPNSETPSVIEIMVPKLDRYQEIIPQREKDKMGVLQNKLKAIELFRKSKMDQRKASKKRRVIVPKEKADLSESSDSD